jgi:hypothetical protein
VSKVAIAPVTLVGPDGSSRPVQLNHQWNRAHFLGMWMYFSHQGVFHHRSLFDEYGQFDLSFRVVADFELLLRYLKDHDPVIIDTAPVALMQTGGLSSRPQAALFVARELWRARLKHRLSRWSPIAILVYLKAAIRTSIASLFGTRALLALTRVRRRIL